MSCPLKACLSLLIIAGGSVSTSNSISSNKTMVGRASTMRNALLTSLKKSRQGFLSLENLPGTQQPQLEQKKRSINDNLREAPVLILLPNLKHGPRSAIIRLFNPFRVKTTTRDPNFGSREEARPPRLFLRPADKHRRQC